jgi:hypothetical protein
MANKAAAATAAATECPPVTGLNGDYLPYSNSFDSSGAFRSRTGSGIKRARTESEMERDALYVLSKDYPLICPDKPALDPAKIKSLLVSVTDLIGSAKLLLEQDDIPPPPL